MINYIAMALSGLLISIPINNPDFYYLGFIALIPALWALQRIKHSGFIHGWILGLFLIAGTSYWIFIPLDKYGGMNIFINIILLLLFFLVYAFFYGLWGWIFKKINYSNLVHPLILAFTWVGIEYVKFLFTPAYTFSTIGYSQRNFIEFLQLADVGGVFLISFITIIINAYIYKIINRKKLRYIIPLVLIFTLIFISGNIKVNNLEDEKFRTINTGIIQTNILPENKWRTSDIKKNMQDIVNDIDYLLKNNQVDLIITPESALTFDIIRNEYYRKIFFNKINNFDTFIQVGSMAMIDDYKKVYNSTFLISPDNEIINRYDKVNLLPFGEYLPFNNFSKNVFGLDFEEIFSFTGYPSWGESITLFETNYGKWKTLICSELIPPIPHKKDFDFFVNISNEGWFGRESLQEQMWTTAIFRAVENRKPLIKSGNNAYSGVIFPDGTFIRKSPADTEEFLIKVPIRKENNTFYSNWGNFIAYISLIFIIILLIRTYFFNSSTRP